MEFLVSDNSGIKRSQATFIINILLLFPQSLIFFSHSDGIIHNDLMQWVGGIFSFYL